MSMWKILKLILSLLAFVVTGCQGLTVTGSYSSGGLEVDAKLPAQQPAIAGSVPAEAAK